MTDAPARPLLQMRAISKTFGTAKALSGVDLDAYAGEVHALMGENGARKIDADEDPLGRLYR